MPHGVPGDRALQEGDFITMDFGVLYQGYCSDMTRTVALGYVTEEMERVYQTVLAAQKAGIAASKAGVPGSEVDGAARKVIADAGYGAYFGHGYGHSLGLEIHEAPTATRPARSPCRWARYALPSRAFTYPVGSASGLRMWWFSKREPAGS